MTDENKCLTCSRRQAIKLGAAGVATLAVGATMPGCGGLEGLSEDVTITLADYPALAEVGGAASVETDALSHPIWILREGEQEYLALSAECDHFGCDVELDDDGQGFTCPCHDSTFARDGALQGGPADEDLLAFDTMLDGETLTILAG